MPSTPARRGAASSAPSRGGRGSYYLDPAALAALVRDYTRTGSVCEDLARALLAIAGGVWDRYRFTPDRDDFAQEVVLHLIVKSLPRADAQKHCFNFLTTCCVNYGRNLRDKLAGDRRRFETYAAELVESGRVLPDRRDK